MLRTATGAREARQHSFARLEREVMATRELGPEVRERDLVAEIDRRLALLWQTTAAADIAKEARALVPADSECGKAAASPNVSQGGHGRAVS